MDPVTPSIGWGVLHLFYRVDHERAAREPGAAKRVLDAVASLQADGHQALVFTVLGHKADLGIMVLGPDLARLAAFQHELAATPLVPTWSYVSLTEKSEYTSTADDERARLVAEGVAGAELEEKVDAFATRMEHYVDARLHPQLPAKAVIGFYPMSKRRDSGANWYELRFEERKRLMGGHAKVGRTYAGRVIQLITGSTGLDDWEWGVTLLTDDPVVLKDIVNEMRFDEASARYAEFGPFFTGLVLDPADALTRLGLPADGPV
ncbi:MAG TPA: chlorite dismutase family protein [Acidimicrobiia bacterium]